MPDRQGRGHDVGAPALTVTGAADVGRADLRTAPCPVAAEGLTVAVRVSTVPENCGLCGEAPSTVVVGIGLTVKRQRAGGGA